MFSHHLLAIYCQLLSSCNHKIPSKLDSLSTTHGHSRINSEDHGKKTIKLIISYGFELEDFFKHVAFIFQDIYPKHKRKLKNKGSKMFGSDSACDGPRHLYA